MKPFLFVLVSLLTGPHLLVAETIDVPADFTTIQAAIDAARRGDTIRVGAGTYRERIKLKPGITVRSAGGNDSGQLGLKRAELTILDGGGESGASPGVTMADGATLDGLTVVNVGRYDDAKWRKHWEERGENQPHEHIGHFGVPGIAVTGVSCTVVNNIVHHVGDTGIAIRGEEETACTPVVSNNVCYRNMGGGIGSMNGSAAIIRGNTCFENFFAGIGHDHADPLVVGNECYGNIRAGIGVSEGACPVVRENRCHGNRRAGIGIRTGSDTRPVIEENDCYENEMTGIGVDEEAAPIIRANRCHHNKLAGIGCRSHSSAVITGNECHENGAAGIGISSAKAVILHNRIERNHAAGIGLSDKSDAVVIDNMCLENRLVAVGIPGGSKALLQDNTLVRTGGAPPVVAILGGSEAVLKGNTIKGGGVAAVLLDGRLDAIDNVLEGQNGGSGILAQKNSRAAIMGNRIKGYRVPVRDRGAQSIIDNGQTQDSP